MIPPRLGIDIDLYITRWQDPIRPVEEAMTMPFPLKKSGKIRAIGISSAAFQAQAGTARRGADNLVAIAAAMGQHPGQVSG